MPLIAWFPMFDASTFLRTGQHEAAAIDNRITATGLAEAGGPEVEAAARIALSGPRSYLVQFLQAGFPQGTDP